MLVLKRRKNQEVCIDDKIRVRLVHVGRNRVRLGVTAPKDVRIERKEVHDRRRMAESIGVEMSAAGDS